MDDHDQPEDERPKDSVPPQEATEEKSTDVHPIPYRIAGFWRRVLGGVVDWIVLAGMSLIIIVVLGQAAYRLGLWARLIGVVLGTLYLGITSSELTDGRSLGKRVAGTQVIDEDNVLLLPGRGLLRGLFLSTMFVGADLIAAIPAFGPLAGALAGAGALLIFYGYIFNRQTRQGTHDLQMKTYVVRYPRPQIAAPPQRGPIHMRVVYAWGGLVVIALVVSSILTIAIPSGNPLERLGLLRVGETDDLFAVQSALLQTGNYRDVGVSRSINTTFINGEVVTYNELQLQVVPKVPCRFMSNRCVALLNDIQETVQEVIPDLTHYDGMLIEFISLVDTGWFEGTVTLNIPVEF